MRFRSLILLTCAASLGACADPEKAAEKAVTSAQSDWTGAKESLDPQKRVKAYKDAIDSVERVGEKYKKTKIGQAIAAGQSAGGVSLARMKSEYASLSERAACYARPTVECLEPFASSGYKYQASNAGTAGQAGQSAAGLICEKGFAAADAALENLKINRPAYSAALVQVALAAGQCEKPNEVKAALKAYLAAEPSTGAARVSALQGLVGNAGLRDAWEMLLPELEKAAQGLPENQAAGVDLTIAMRSAELGAVDVALAKFRRVTEELGYNVDINTRLDTAGALIASGHADEGFGLLDSQPNAVSLRMTALHNATQILGGRVGAVRAAGSPNANIPLHGDYADFFVPASAELRKREAPIAAKIEAALDDFVAARQPNGQYLGMVGADAAFARLALIQQKLGDSAKANALVEKAEGARKSMMHPGTYSPDAPSYAGEFEVLVAVGQGDVDRAVAWLPRVTPTGNDITGLVLRALGKAGKAEEALTLAAQTNRAGANTYQMLIQELGANGHVKKAEQVLNAFPGDATSKSAIAWSLVEAAAGAGKMKDAEKLVDTYSLTNIPAYRLRLVELRADEAISKNDRKKAESLIREMFSIGQEFDQMAAAERTNAFYAQNAARKAFSAGYVDLGLELYKSASAKDQRPFFDAFTKNSKASDYPRILMAAHDNLGGDELSYVIDAAIRGLKGEK